MTKWLLSNIFDEVSHSLDQKVFRGTTPRPTVVHFLRRELDEAIRKEFGVHAEEYLDMYLTGSLTTYQYGPTSDCDLSIFPAYDSWPGYETNPGELRRKLYHLFVDRLDGNHVPGTRHPIQHFVVQIGTTPADLYAPGERSAWSFQTESWVVAPESARAHDVATDMPLLFERAQEMASKMEALLIHDPKGAKEFYDQIHKKRVDDETHHLGDFSEGNIIYKYLLHQGLFDQLKNLGFHVWSKTANPTWDPELQRKLRMKLYQSPARPDDQQTYGLEGDVHNMMYQLTRYPTGTPEHDGAMQRVHDHLISQGYNEQQIQAMLFTRGDFPWGLPRNQGSNWYSTTDLEGGAFKWNPDIPEPTFFEVCPECQMGDTHLEPTGNRKRWEDYDWDEYRCDHCGYTHYEQVPDSPDYALRLASQHLKVIYDFDFDRIWLGTTAEAQGSPRNAIVGEYDGQHVTLNEQAGQWLNANYFKKLWHHSFPSKPFEHLFVHHNGQPLHVPTRPVNMDKTPKLPDLDFNPPVGEEPDGQTHQEEALDAAEGLQAEGRSSDGEGTPQPPPQAGEEVRSRHGQQADDSQAPSGHDAPRAEAVREGVWAQASEAHEGHARLSQEQVTSPDAIYWPSIEEVEGVGEEFADNWGGWKLGGRETVEGVLGSIRNLSYGMFGAPGKYAEGDIFDLAADLTYDVQGRQGSVEGNKRLATGLCVYFLEHNGWPSVAEQLDIPSPPLGDDVPNGAFGVHLLNVVEGRDSLENFANWMRQEVAPTPELQKLA